MLFTRMVISTKMGTYQHQSYSMDLIMLCHPSSLTTVFRLTSTMTFSNKSSTPSPKTSRNMVWWILRQLATIQQAMQMAVM